jgi:hypothetical protein
MIMDWALFDRIPESLCYCRCGATYRSHTQMVSRDDKLVIVSRKPCPLCGLDEGNVAHTVSSANGDGS